MIRIEIQEDKSYFTFMKQGNRHLFDAMIGFLQFFVPRSLRLVDFNFLGKYIGFIGRISLHAAGGQVLRIGRFVGNKTVCHMKGGRGSGNREGGGSKVEHVQKSIQGPFGMMSSTTELFQDSCKE